MTSTDPGRRSPALLTGALAFVTLVAVVIAVFLGVRYAKFDDSLAGQSDRTDALAAAEQFALRMDAINGADPQAWVKSVKHLLTTKARATFDREYAAVQKLGTDKDTHGSGSVLATGLSDIDPDSATAMVVHDAVVTNKSGTTGRHYRWTVDLQKVHGTWLIDNFSQVE